MLNEISKLKRKVKYNYLLYQKTMDKLDCGINLAEYMSGTIATAKHECNNALDKLAKIDSSTPKARL